MCSLLTQLLSATQMHATIAHDGVEAVLEQANEVVGVGHLGHVDDAL